MSEKVVLPKFDLPGDRIHPALKVMIGIGTVLVVAILILGGALWHRRSLQLAAVARQEALIAARTAEANAAAEASKARQAEAAARVAADQAKLAAKAAAKVEAKGVLASAEAPKASGGSRHRLHRSSSRSGSKALAKAGAGDDKKVAPKAGSKRDDAAIDKLLASFNKK